MVPDKGSLQGQRACYHGDETSEGLLCNPNFQKIYQPTNKKRLKNMSKGYVKQFKQQRQVQEF